MIDSHRKREADGGSLLDMMLNASPDNGPESEKSPASSCMAVESDQNGVKTPPLTFRRD